ncbi:unnamed protein product [Adineta steineri]|uniref:Uncharacterized protein n=1 Tax=Adineta steineri TaxID=433720 RepID=A0A815LZQ1_9BILA|nr:unnamed protein product [Adineta steineri]
MSRRLAECIPQGGGDGPEAVVDALHAALNLSWRDATKICVLIVDAPPHGLDPNGDAFPNGCPCGRDPVRVVEEMAEERIILYTVGVEPSIGIVFLSLSSFSKMPYSFFILALYRGYYQELSRRGRGEYIRLADANVLAQKIITDLRS